MARNERSEPDNGCNCCSSSSSCVYYIALLPLPVCTTLLYFLFLCVLHCSTSSSCVYNIALLPLPVCTTLLYFLFLCVLHCSTSSSCVYYIALLPLPVCTTLLYFLFLCVLHCSTSSSFVLLPLPVYTTVHSTHTKSYMCFCYAYAVYAILCGGVLFLCMLCAYGMSIMV